MFYHSLYKYGRKQYNTEAVRVHDEYSDNDDYCDDSNIYICCLKYCKKIKYIYMI